MTALFWCSIYWYDSLKKFARIEIKLPAFEWNRECFKLLKRKFQSFENVIRRKRRERTKLTQTTFVWGGYFHRRKWESMTQIHRVQIFQTSTFLRKLQNTHHFRTYLENCTQACINLARSPFRLVDHLIEGHDIRIGKIEQYMTCLKVVDYTWVSA